MTSVRQLIRLQNFSTLREFLLGAKADGGGNGEPCIGGFVIKGVVSLQETVKGGTLKEEVTLLGKCNEEKTLQGKLNDQVGLKGQLPEDNIIKGRIHDCPL